MKVEVKLLEKMKLAGSNENGKVTYFDAYSTSGGDAEYASPMEVLLQSLAGCTAMDVLSIIRKKRKSISAFKIYVDAVQSEEHPRVFTKIHLMYELVSEDAQIEDLDRAIDLSMEKYCSVSRMLKNGGVKVTWALVFQM